MRGHELVIARRPSLWQRARYLGNAESPLPAGFELWVRPQPLLSGFSAGTIWLATKNAKTPNHEDLRRGLLETHLVARSGQTGVIMACCVELLGFEPEHFADRVEPELIPGPPPGTIVPIAPLARR